jgi:hypothetical protein
MGSNPWCISRCFEEESIQFPPPLAQAGNADSLDFWKGSFDRSRTKVVANPEEMRPPCLLSQTQSSEDGNACGHETLTAGFFPRKRLPLIQLDFKSPPAQQNRQRRTRNAAACNE